MAWARIDDGFPDHPKVIGLSLEAVGLWTLVLAWAHRHHQTVKNPGLVPDAVLQRYAGRRAKRLASELWSAGLFDNHDGFGWPIHDFCDYLPSPELLAARARAGRAGGLAKAQNRRSALASASEVLEQNASKSLPVPVPVPKEKKKDPPSEASPSDAIKIRPEVEALCTRLADRIEANGSKRPRPGKAWHDAARLLLDADGRTVPQVERAIDWCQGHEFWRAHILSMPKLREKYDQMRLQATGGDITQPGKLDRSTLPESLR